MLCEELLVIEEEGNAGGMLDIINLTNGVEVTHQMCLVRCLCSPICPGISGSVTHSAGGAVSTCSYSVSDDGFTALVMLLPGVNHIVAQYATHVVTRQVVFTPPQQEKFVRLIYVTAFDEEKFQGPAGMDRSVNAAVRRIQTGVLALQTFMAESLHEEGLDRKTFKLELTPKGLPKGHMRIFHGGSEIFLKVKTRVLVGETTASNLYIPAQVVSRIIGGMCRLLTSTEGLFRE
ncbi:hypothetical protein FHG87_005884 [Trinorchestia longiramus]|nr:hypothetical protein FHG87_005884 [Trinorchestia longiramus]